MAKIKQTEQNESSSQASNLLISATAGTIIGATAALLLTPKSGKRLRNDLYEAYENISEKGQDIIEDVVERGQKVADSASEYAANIKDGAANMLGTSQNSTSNTNLILGALGGGILGAAAIFLLLPSHDDDNTEGLTSKIKAAAKSAKKINWIETAKDIMETIQSKVSDYPQHNGSVAAEEEDEEGSHEKSTFHDVLKLASTGLRLWQNVKKRR